MKNRDYRLVVEGKFNLKAIMQRAWVYMRQNKSIKWYTFKNALCESWVDARVAMDEYKRSLLNEPLFSKKNLSLSDFYFDPFGNLANGNVCR